VEEKLDPTVDAQSMRNTKTDIGPKFRRETSDNRYDSELEDDLIVSNGVLSVAFDR
jgi:hypothetical protein